MRFRLGLAKILIPLGQRAVSAASSIFHLAAWIVGQQARVEVNLVVGPRIKEGQEPDWAKAFLITNTLDGQPYLVTPQTVDLNTMNPAKETKH